MRLGSFYNKVFLFCVVTFFSPHFSVVSRCVLRLRVKGRHRQPDGMRQKKNDEHKGLRKDSTSRPSRIKTKTLTSKLQTQ